MKELLETFERTGVIVVLFFELKIFDMEYII
jgi:hypothetical protein